MRPPKPSRRELFAVMTAYGMTSPVFQRAVAAQAETPAKDEPITEETIRQAEWISGIKLKDEDRKALVGTLRGLQSGYAELRKTALPNSVPPALTFMPSGQAPFGKHPRGTVTAPTTELKKPASEEDLAFMPLTSLATLVRTKQISSLELTRLYLGRLKKYDPALKCVVTLTEDLALKQAAAADAEIAAGKYSGPLHGIPWGAKDLIAYPGYKTTWGATPFKDQQFDTKAAVAAKLDEAGAVLVAKLTLGALAMGDQWFGGMTRNPWNVKQGSSGSSAGSASAVSAGLVGFAIGSETLGSIVSPCTRCGSTGLRPTFGRVSRAGCMTLCWSMDKLGPITRTVEDAALVFGAIHGADPADAASVDQPFDWPAKRDLKKLKVGYVTRGKERPDLEVLKTLGVELVEIKLPIDARAFSLMSILDVECAAAFDEITRAGITEGLNSWPNTFRAGQFVPAVEYLRANRVRTQLMQEMAKVFEKIDLYVGGNDLILTNYTGHPTVVMPYSAKKLADGDAPSAITFTGKLYGESELLAVANAFQQATGTHLRRPNMAKTRES